MVSALAIIIGALLGVYLFGHNGSTVAVTENTIQKNSSSTPTGNGGKVKNGVEKSGLINTPKPQSRIVTDDFSINLPTGWEETTSTQNISVTAVNIGERIDDSAAQKINFKTYFAVAYEALKERSVNEYIKVFKDFLAMSIPGTVFTKEQDISINGKSAHAIEMELIQDGVGLKVLSVIIEGRGGNVWVMSFNTTKKNWNGYKEMFYSIANSFSLKK